MSDTEVWEEAVAWAAVATLAGVQADWVSAETTSMLRRALGSLTPEQVRDATQRRAAAFNLRCSAADAEAVRGLVVETCRERAFLGLSDGTAVFGYMDPDGLERSRADLSLTHDAAGSVTVRATSFPASIIKAIRDSGYALAALDLSGSMDPEEQRVGLGVLREYMVPFAAD